MAKARRSQGRQKRGKQRRSADAVAVKERTALQDLGALILVGFGTFWLLSLISSYWIGSRTENSAGEVVYYNLMGPMGRVVATLSDGFLGYTSVLVALVVFWWAYRVAERGSETRFSGRGIFRSSLGLLGLILAAGLVFATIWGQPGGGMVGIRLAQPISIVSGVGGVVLVAFLLMVLSLAALVGESSFVVARDLTLLLFRVIAVSLTAIVKVVLGGLALVFGLGASIVTLLVSLPLRIFRRRALEPLDVEEPEVIAPKPKRRKNRVEDPVAPEELEEEADLPAVVKRRSRSISTKSLPKKPEPSATPEVRSWDYIPPPIELLTASEASETSEDDGELIEKSRLIEEKLKDFNIAGRVTQIHPGPVITLFEFEPAAGVKVGRIAALQDDLAMSLRASSIRIIAPIPKRGTVGIEVPNRHRDVVRLRDILQSDLVASGGPILKVPIGKDIYGEPIVADIGKMPHLLVAGATGTGKSVFINSVLLSLLYRAVPEELGLILIDPKVLELSVYEGIPHLRVPVVTVPRQARAVLEWAVKEMERRYRLMQRFGVRSIDGYNQVVAGSEEGAVEPADGVISLKEESVVEGGIEPSGAELIDESAHEQPIVEQLQPLAKIVIVIDELADLMLTVGREIEELITRLSQKARAAGIHLIVATQRPSVDVVTGLIKANFPARLSFRVSSRIDSRTILDSGGAEKLLGKGDMLFVRPGAEDIVRVHGAFVSDTEVIRVVKAAKECGSPQYDARIMELCQRALEEDNEKDRGELGQDGVEYDAFYDQAVELVMKKGQASTSMLQRAFRIGYNRAARIIDVMEQEGLVGPIDGSKPREVLVPHREASAGE